MEAHRTDYCNTGHSSQEEIICWWAWPRVPSSLQRLVVFKVKLFVKKWTSGGKRKGKWLPSNASQNHESSRNDPRDDNSVAVVAKIAGRKVLRGRNMQKTELLKREIGKKEGSNERLEISGKDASKKSPEAAEHSLTNTQDNREASQQAEKQKEYANRNTPSSTSSDSLYPKAASSKASVFDEHHNESAQEDDSKEFLEAADEVVNLMRKDYRGMDRPRRKPPINNHEPKN